MEEAGKAAAAAREVAVDSCRPLCMVWVAVTAAAAGLVVAGSEVVATASAGSVGKARYVSIGCSL